MAENILRCILRVVKWLKKNPCYNKPFKLSMINVYFYIKISICIHTCIYHYMLIIISTLLPFSPGQHWQPAKVTALVSSSSTLPVRTAALYLKCPTPCLCRPPITALSTTSTWRTVSWQLWRRSTSSAPTIPNSLCRYRSWCLSSSWPTSLHGKISAWSFEPSFYIYI